MPRTRTALVAAALLAATLAAPAAAAPRPATPAAQAAQAAQAAPANGQAVRGGSPSSAVDRVADFYGAYIDAMDDQGGGRLATDLRAHYLTAALRRRLAVWERREHADGVLRAQDVPSYWKVAYDNSGAGHAWTRVQLTWGTGRGRTFTYLRVQSDLATKKISDIQQGRVSATSNRP